MKLSVYLSSMVLVTALGCDGVKKADFSNVKGRVGKLEGRMTANENVDLGQNGLLLQQIQEMEALKNASAQNQMGAGPSTHLPSHLAGMPIVRVSDPYESRYALTQMWDQVQGKWVWREREIVHDGPIAGYPGSAPGGTYQPPQPSAPGPVYQQPPLQQPQPQQLPPAQQAAPQGGLAGGGQNLGDVRSQIQSATGFLRDVKDLREVADELFGGGTQQQQLSAINQRLDQLSAGQLEQTKLTQQLLAENDRLEKEQIAAQGDLNRLKKVVNNHVARLKALGYAVEKCSQKPVVTVTREYIYVWRAYGYYGGRSCQYYFGCTPAGVIHYYPCY